LHRFRLSSWKHIFKELRQERFNRLKLFYPNRQVFAEVVTDLDGSDIGAGNVVFHAPTYAASDLRVLAKGWPEVTLKLEIDAEVPAGLDRSKVRTLLENATTLGFIDKVVS
jgi:hypothetical protein